MKREPVVSTNIAAIGYDPDALVLEVQFLPARKTGLAPVWQYKNVTPVEHANLIRNHSIGKAFAKIRETHNAIKVALVGPDGIEHPWIEEAS